MNENTPVGIHNYGWNCFINSLLQCLSCSNELKKIFISFDETDNNILQVIKNYNLKFSNNNKELVNICNNLLHNKGQLNITNNLTKNDIIKIIKLIKDKHLKLYLASFKNII